MEKCCCNMLLSSGNCRMMRRRMYLRRSWRQQNVSAPWASDSVTRERSTQMNSTFGSKRFRWHRVPNHQQTKNARNAWILLNFFPKIYDHWNMKFKQTKCQKWWYYEKLMILPEKLNRHLSGIFTEFYKCF